MIIFFVASSVYYFLDWLICLQSNSKQPDLIFFWKEVKAFSFLEKSQTPVKLEPGNLAKKHSFCRSLIVTTASCDVASHYKATGSAKQLGSSHIVICSFSVCFSQPRASWKSIWEVLYLTCLDLLYFQVMYRFMLIRDRLKFCNCHFIRKKIAQISWTRIDVLHIRCHKISLVAN